MQTNTLKVLSLAVGATVLLTACDGLGKMIKKQNLITYEVTPKPLEMHGDSVGVTISGKYPAKLFAKKAVVTVTPVIKYGSGEKTLKPVTLVGEKATGSGQKISYEKGGTFTYTDKVGYDPGMKVAKLEIRAQGAVKKKTKDFKGTEIADGTIITPLLVRNDEKGIFAKDAFVKVTAMNQTANIYYVINQSVVRPSEMKSEEMKSLQNFITSNASNTMWFDFKGIEVSAYASPDGELTLNAKLAENRAKSGSDALRSEFKKVKDKSFTFGKDETAYKVVTTAEDWDGFKKLMESSSIADKDLVLRVLSMYADPVQREKEIKNLSKTYKEVADQILPKLRRSVLTVIVDKKSRTDEMITRLASTNPDSLSIEELLYGATLTQDVNTKMNIYKAAEKQYASDWRASNNLGVTYLMTNKIDDAKAAFERANKASANNPIVMNNMGAVVAKSGDRRAAMDYYNKANGAGPEVNYNKGIVLVRDGKYADAVSAMGSYKGFNLALAQMLNGSAESVNGTIDASTEKDMAMSYYLKAIAAARKGDATNGLAALKTAIEKDGSLKAMAKDDCEFLKWRDNADFKGLTS
ncbi:MAG: tetratricopeptide repeat protein [Bacteroidia bacterium]